MAVIRINKTTDYTVMSNAHFREKKMSLKAKGLLSLMLSLPDDWDYSIAGLCALSRDGKDSIMNAMQELEARGYLTRTRVFDEQGRFAGYEYDIFEAPRAGAPYTENPNTENPNTENPPQLNTNTLNTQKSNTQGIKDIVEYLNQRAGTNYRTSGKLTQTHIAARLKEGFTVDDCKVVIDKKCAEWKGTDMEQYLRPSTLFGSKFEQYLNANVNIKGASGFVIDHSKNDLDDIL